MHTRCRLSGGSSSVVLGAWGMKQSAQLQKQVDKLNGDDANLQAPKYLDEGPQLDGRQQAAQGVDAALQLLQDFAMVGGLYWGFTADEGAGGGPVHAWKGLCRNS